MSYRGTCHCGRCVFEVQTELQTEVRGAAAQAGPLPDDARQGCRTRGGTLVSVPRDRLRLLSSEEGVGAYTFSGRIIGHRFCGACGTHLYGEALDSAGPGIAYLNPACISRGERAATASEDAGAGAERARAVAAG
jgi:hypothetical protein